MSYLGNAPGVESQRLTTSFTATAAQTAFNPVGGYTLGYVDVYLNGVKLIDGTDFTADDGVTVTLSSGASAGDAVELVCYTPRGLSDGYTKSEADAKYTTVSDFESTGIDDNAASTAVTIDSSGNLLVGTTSKSAATGQYVAHLGTNISSQELAICSYQKEAAIFNRISTDGDLVHFRKNGSTVGSIGAEGGDLVIGTGSTAGLQFNDATPTIRPWNMSANTRTDGVCDLGYSNARFKDLYLSGGVYLGGTGSANKLDDYEEGTFTPAIASTYGFTKGTVTGASGVYTKIGDIVHAYITFDSFGSTESVVAGDRFSFSGLPFTAQSVGGALLTGNVGTAHIYSSMGSGINATGIVSAESSGGWVLFNAPFGAVTYNNQVFLTFTYKTTA